jgi:hypothetical protein
MSLAHCLARDLKVTLLLVLTLISALTLKHRLTIITIDVKS